MHLVAPCREEVSDHRAEEHPIPDGEERLPRHGPAVAVAVGADDVEQRLPGAGFQHAILKGGCRAAVAAEQRWLHPCGETAQGNARSGAPQGRGLRSRVRTGVELITTPASSIRLEAIAYE